MRVRRRLFVTDAARRLTDRSVNEQKKIRGYEKKKNLNPHPQSLQPQHFDGACLRIFLVTFFLTSK